MPEDKVISKEQVAAEKALKANKKITGKEQVGTNPTTDTEFTSDDLAQRYGFTLALLNSDPELRKTFRRAVQEGWTADKFIAQMRDTDWFQKNSEQWRNAQVLMTTDPGEWKSRQKQVSSQLQDAAATMGAVVSPKVLKSLTESALMFGWNDAQQRNVLAGYVKATTSGPLTGQYIGNAGRTYDQLRQTALRNGYTIPKGKADQWIKSIASGDSTVEDWQDFIRRQTASTFPGFKDELMAGADLDDLASPYMERMAQMLELNPNTVKLSDPTIRKALAGTRDPKTGKVLASTVYDFEDTLRKDPRWMKTNNAHEQVLGMGRSVLQQFGYAI